ncbi:MAG TPA: condensation domain-containing protein, partial [Thermoanaerobaculia bacterium]|nr:condensation domain-containing protein [Thermoanaerobaculia bacterium]
MTSTAQSLIEVLRRRAAETPDLRLYTFLADGERECASLTCAELDERARALGSTLQHARMQGERALLLFPPGLDFIAAFWGCLYAGAVAVPAYPPKERSSQLDPRLLAILQDARPRAVLTTSAILVRLQGLAARLPGLPGLTALTWIAVDDVPLAAAEGWEDPNLAPSALAFLQYTSGSTALPKGVMVGHGNLLHNEEMIRRAFGQSATSVIVGWLPLYHDMGLIGNVLQPLYVGARCILMSPLAFLQRPRRWLEAISRYRATTSGGPNFAYDLCVRKIGEKEREGLDLGSWEVAFDGAEPVRAATLERFAAAFAPHGFRREAFYPCYGLAEATLFVSGGERDTPPQARRFRRADLERHRAVPAPSDEEDALELVSAGHAFLGQRIAIADPETGARCPPGQVGEIWIAGPSVAAGYWNRPEETARTFAARLPDDEDAYLRTGDLGFADGGELFVAGRLKDLIVLRGRNLYPQDVELAAEGSHPALRPGESAAFAVDLGDEEKLVVVAGLDRRAAIDPAAAGPVLDAIRRAVAERLEAQVHDVVLVRAGTIPKTSSGKVQRHACKAAYLAGTLEPVARSTALADAADDEVPGGAVLTRAALLALPAGERLPALLAYLGERAARAARLERGSLAPDEPLLGLDSLAALELGNAVEADLGTALSLPLLLGGPTLAGLAAEVMATLDGDATRTGESAEEPLLPAAEPPTEFPLSHGQRALWYLDRLAPDAGAYNLAAAARVAGDLDPAALVRALTALAARHPIFRTTFAAVDGEPRQRIGPGAEVDFATADLAGASDADFDERLHAEAFRPFDLENGPLLRLRLLSRGSERVLLFAIHHLVTDLWSLALVWRELAALYQGADPATLPPLPGLAYSDYVDWQHRRLAGGAGSAGEKLLAYWREQLSGAELPDLALPTDRPRPPVQTQRGGSEPLRLGAASADRLRALARRGESTLFGVLLAGFQALLHRYTGQEDVAVGSPVSGRIRAALADLPGYLVNAVVLRGDFGDVGGDPSFALHLERTGRTAAAALAHQDYPFALLAEKLRPQRDPSRSPLFQAFFALQRSPADRQA